MSKNFQNPAASSHNAQPQIQQNDNPVAPLSGTQWSAYRYLEGAGPYPPEGKRQFKMPFSPQTFGANACHPERSEGSGSTDAEILRCAQDDSQAFSPRLAGQQGENYPMPGVPPSKRASQFRAPTTPFFDVPTAPLQSIPVTPRTSIPPTNVLVPLAGTRSQAVPATPRAGILPTIVDPRIHKHVEHYAQWLLLNNKLAASPQKMQAYQDAALEIKQVGKREVRTFAPFQEHTSALKVITSDQFTILAMLTIYWSLGLFFLHLATLAITLGIITLLYICGFVTSGMLATQSFSSSSSGEKIDEEIILALDELGVEWPTYTILCPVYKEATIVPQFVEAIKALDYPMDRLQVLFLTEENDNETRAALYCMNLPPNFTILTVPKGTPQTKPRACNFGLLQAKGQFIVIFDAEDKPEPYQLKKAVLTFANLGSEVACVQAKLNYYNSRQNLLTRWFTAEYSTWFDIMLPGLQRTGFSLPLGGTSNHFRTEALRALGGWDAFNVTEDCDLGLRISQYGLKTAVLDSTTYEEATSRIKTWLLQRSRWIKGYLQTYLVHMRHPVQTLRQGHVRKFCSLQLIVGAWTIVLLLNPFMWALTLCYMLFRLVHLYSTLFPGPILYLAVFCLIFGNFFYVYIQLIGCLQRQEYALIKWVLLIPFYWAMMSASAYIAFYQLIVKPHHWEKTQHGTHLGSSPQRNTVAPLSATQWSAYQSFEGERVSILRGRMQVPTILPDIEPEGQAVATSMPTTRIFAVTVGRVFKQVATPNTLETTTQRVIALRRALATQIGQRRVRRQEHLPHIRDLWFVATVIIACIISITACWYYFQQHEILLYGDSLAHLQIARGVFDSATPGLAQLGGDWLPLSHILMWPFIWNDYLWRTGLAGSFAAMPCYIVSAAYIFLSARRLTKNSLASFLGTLVFILNPNILYVQSTPLSEMTCIVTFTLACYYFLVWVYDHHTRHLIFAAAATFLATLARYDGWSLFLAILVMIPVIDLMRRKSLTQIIANEIIFAILAGFGIVLWLSWNKIIFGDPLFFQHGSYSAQAQQMVYLHAHLLYTYHNLWVTIYTFSLDTIEITGPTFCILAIIAVAVFILQHRLKPETIAIMVFFVPFVFYVTSLYTGQAALFLPNVGSNHTLFNVRYGAQMVPSIAVFIAILAAYLKFLKYPRWSQIALLAVIMAQTVVAATGGIISVQDGQYGISCAPEHPIKVYLAQHYAEGKILEDTYTSKIYGEEAGIHFSNFIYEGSGQLWTDALKNPAGTVDWIIVNPGDPNDLVFTYINNHSSTFNIQFTLVVQEFDQPHLRLYHRNGLPPLPTRPVPPSLLTEHQLCNSKNK